MVLTKVHATTHLLMAAANARAPNIEQLQNDTPAETKKWKHTDAHEGVLKKGVPAGNQTWLAGKYRMYSWFSYENFIYNQPAMLDFHIFHIKTSIYRGFSHENPEFRNGFFPFKPPSITRGLIHRSQPRTIDARFASGLALALARSEKNMTRLAGKSYLK